jgi:hypothetical protein
MDEKEVNVKLLLKPHGKMLGRRSRPVWEDNIKIDLGPKMFNM